MLPFGELLQFGKLGAVVQGGDEGGEEIGGGGWELRAEMLDEVGDVPRDSHVAGHRKFWAGEESFELAEEGSVQLRFEQGDEVAEEGDARRGVGVGRSVQSPVRGENLAGFLQLAEHDEGEHQIVDRVPCEPPGILMHSQWVGLHKRESYHSITSEGASIHCGKVSSF